MEDFTEIVRGLIAKINLTLEVKSIVGDKVFLCETLFLTIEKIITDEGGNEYKVTEFLDNEWITVIALNGAPAQFAGTVVICPPITFLHGSPSSVNNEYVQIKVRSKQKLPLIWFRKPFKEKKFGRGSSLEREAIPNLYFLDETDPDGWLNDEFQRRVIKPQSNLAEAWLSVAENDRRFKSVEFSNQFEHVRLGVQIADQGSDGKLIDENLSGVEAQPLMIKYKGFNCACK